MLSAIASRASWTLTSNFRPSCELRAVATMTAKPLLGVRVLVTRPQDPDSEFARLLQERGAAVQSLPLIALGPPPNEREVAAAIERLESFDWLVFTSAAGVTSFSQRRRQPLSASKPRLAAVGPATARAVEAEFGRRVDLVPDQFSGEALADALLGRVTTSDRILVMQAADARQALAARLRGAGLQVQTVAAYSTVEVRPPELEERIAEVDVIALASPSAVHSLVHALGEPRASAKLRGKLIACIGPVTLFEARQAGLHVEIVPKSTTLPALVDALCTYYSTRLPQR
jgi:uroporphyrinogen III methyltransferase / synthase